MFRTYLGIASISGFLAVAFGAFGAHGLESILDAEQLATYQTAVEYHMAHTLALFGVSLLLLQFPSDKALRLSGGLFIIGIIVFSGSLYVLSVSGIRWLGAITPIGGLGFLGGWFNLLRFAYSQRKD